MVQTERFPVTQPIDWIVAGLNAYQPMTVLGYPSALALLAVEARDGRLRIAPKRLMSTSEPLLPEVRRSVEEPSGRRSPTSTGPPRPDRSGPAAGAAPACTSPTTW
jgi:phenylacetate-coenzyme A ligase PaaK-like adenylate-forming protein